MKLIKKEKFDLFIKQDYASNKVNIVATEVLQVEESVKQNRFIPRIIGRNSDISSRSKFNKNGAKYVKRG